MKNQIGYFLFFVVAAVACFAIRSASPSQTVNASRAVTSIADLADPLIESDAVQGMSVGVVRIDDQGKLKTETYHFGQVQTKRGPGKEPHLPTDQTLYEVGAISNIFTGMLLASASERGEADLKTTVASQVDGAAQIPRFENHEITLIDLCLHRSGLPRLADNMPLSDSEDPYTDYTSGLAREFLAKTRLTKMPGKSYEFSNFGVSYLGYLLTKAAGAIDYDKILNQRITGPLGMSATRVNLDDEASQLAIGHKKSGAPTSPWHFADMPGAGGVRTSIEDMNRFMIASLQPPEGKIGRVIDLAFEKQADPIGDEFAMGMGWMIARDGSTRFQRGETGGYHASVFVSRELKMGVCVLANTANNEVSRVTERMMQWMAGIKVMVPANQEQIAVSKKQMDQCVGRYELNPTFVFDVRRDGDRLMVGVTNQPTHRVYPRSETEWFYQVIEAALRFGDIKDGKPQSVTLLQNGVEQTAKRISD